MCYSGRCEYEDGFTGDCSKPWTEICLIDDQEEEQEDE